MWAVEYTDEFDAWWNTLGEDEQNIVAAAVANLEQDGPNLGRPLVDRIHTSKYHNMKELRPRPGNIRILFMFDPRRVAILLLGGNKVNAWEVWYQQNVKIADALYDQYLAELREEGLL